MIVINKLWPHSFTQSPFVCFITYLLIISVFVTVYKYYVNNYCCVYSLLYPPYLLILPGSPVMRSVSVYIVDPEYNC